MKRKLFLLSLILSIGLTSYSQQIQSPEEYFGIKFGEKFHFHSQIVEYAKYLATHNTKNTKLFTTGKTSEGRDMIVMAFGSEENINNLEQIRKANLQNIGLLEGENKSEVPAIIMLSYNVHGNEAVNTEVALFMLYELGKVQSEVGSKIFKNSIVLIDPCVNPDGFDRYSQWYNRQIGKKYNANPDAVEHKEPWPGGRFNHYYFDLNRDLAWQTQIESQQRMAFYNSWMPHFHADFHEMGPNSSNFFAPSAKPYHEDLTNFQKTFQNTIGEYHKREFDKNGWLYFSKYDYDLLYPSYGDTYPSFNGAIAMTYEQGGSGAAGLGYARTQFGDTLTLKERMTRTKMIGLAALEGVSTNAELIKTEFNKYFSSVSKNGFDKYKSFVMKGKSGNMIALAQLLDKLQINYSFASKKSSANGFSYKLQGNENFSIEPNDLIINTYQPKGIFTKILFEPHTMLEDSNTYDITAWALPYAYGLEAYAVTQKLQGETSQLTLKPYTPDTGKHPYAYILKLESFENYKWMARALQEKIHIKVQPEKFVINDINYPAGTIVLLRLADQKFDQKIEKLLKEQPAELVPVYSGMVDDGMDFGYDAVRLVNAPQVGIIMGQGVSPTGFGDIWHFFDQQLEYPATLLDQQLLLGVDLSKYQVLVFPGGRYDKSITESKELQDWVTKGGRLILFDDACRAFAGIDGYEIKEKPKSEVKANLNKKYGNAERDQISNMVPGAIYEVNLDSSHPLAYGYNGTISLLIRKPNNFEPLQRGWNVGQLGDYKSGFVGKNIKESIKGATVFAVQDKGRGKVIYLTESPIFRSFWYSGKNIFANAVFFVK